MSKVRNGFVSNSSSSSFIIGCEKLPITFRESLDVFFGDKQKGVSPQVAKYLFENFKNYTLDFEKLMELAKNPDLNDLYEPFSPNNNYDENNYEGHLLNELWSDFSYQEERGNRYKIGYWDEEEPTPYQQYIECNSKEPQYINEKWNNKKWEEEKKLRAEWFGKEEVLQKWIEYVEKETVELRKYPIHMEVEVEDDFSLGAEIEHEFSWDYYFPAVMRFSHH